MRAWLCLVAAAIAASSSAPASAEWREASTKHFLVYSEGSAESLQDFATKLEKFDKAMRLRLGVEDLDLGPANRVTVYIVDNVAQVQRLVRARGSDVAGFYVARAGHSIAVTPRKAGAGGAGDLDPATILLHEYSHHLMVQSEAIAYPAWFTEGFAEFHGTSRFEKDGGLGLGAPANHRAWGLLGLDPQPIETLLDPTGKKLDAFQWEATIYGRGWLLTHYLYFQPERRGQLATYIRAINSGKGSLDAAKEAFGDLGKLDRELKDYLKQKRLPYLRLKPEAVAVDPVAVRPVGAGESAIMDLRIRSRLGITEAEAPRLAKEMRAKAAPFPNDPAVQAALAEAEYDANNFDAAEAAADRAIAADPKHVGALLYKARVKMARAEKAKSADAAAWKEIRALIVRANRADPDNPEPLMLFYHSFGAEGLAPTRNAVTGLVQAFALAPHDDGLRITVARQHLHDGKAAEARRALAPLAFDPHGGETAQMFAGLLPKLDKGDTKGALEAWDAAAAAAEEKARAAAAKRS